MSLRNARAIISSPWQRTLYVMLFAQLIIGVGFSSIFPFLPLYVASLGTTTGLSIELLAGMVFSAQAITMMLASPAWGVLADRYGRKVMVERSLFGGALVMLLMAFARSAEELVLLRAVQGLITGTLAAVNAMVASTAPRERTGYAMGLLQVGLNGGLALGPLVGGVIADVYGYSAAFYVTAALLVIAGVMVLVGVRDESVHLEALTDRTSGSISGWRHILAQPGVIVIYLSRFMSQLGRMMFIPASPLFIQLLMPGDVHINTFTGLVSGISAGTATLSSVYLGRLGDNIGHRRILIASLGVSALLYLPQSFVMTGLQFLVLQALAGVALGGILPIISSLLARHTPPGEEGAVFGLDNSMNSAARAIAPMLFAAVAMWLGLRATFAFIALVYVLAGLLVGRFLPGFERAGVACGNNQDRDSTTLGPAA